MCQHFRQPRILILFRLFFLGSPGIERRQSFCNVSCKQNTAEAIFIKTKKHPRADALMINQQCSIFPGRRQPSIFNDEKLNFCVRDGNRWTFSLLSPGMVQSILYSDNCIKLYYLLNQSLVIKPSTYQYQSATSITALPLLTYQPGSLPGVLLV